MGFQVHADNPEVAVEAAFLRIQNTRMAGLPILNPEIAVQAVDFQRWQGHWLGVVIAPWCMSVLLLPGSSENWQVVDENQRRFIKFPAGDFAFLGNTETELGHYQSCALFSPMDKFASQREALMTARASLIGLLSVPPQPSAPSVAEPPKSKPALSRRGFFTLRKS